MMEPEIIFTPDPHAGPLTAVKGMLLQSSLEELKTLGCYDEYCKLIGEPRLHKLTAYLVGEWVPLEDIRAHYHACDALRLTPMELEEMGRRVGDRLQSRLMSTLAATARRAGFSPWHAIAPLYRMAGRVFQGSTSRVLKLGPKELEATVYGNSLVDFAYFRTAYCGTARGMMTIVGARNIHVRIAQPSAQARDFTLRVTWS